MQNDIKQQVAQQIQQHVHSVDFAHTRASSLQEGMQRDPRTHNPFNLEMLFALAKYVVDNGNSSDPRVRYWEQLLEKAGRL